MTTTGLTSVPADRLGAPPQTDSDDTAAAEHHRQAARTNAIGDIQAHNR